MVTHADAVVVSRQSSSDAECGKGGVSEGEQGAEITRNLAYFLHRQSLVQILFYHWNRVWDLQGGDIQLQQVTQSQHWH